jgi:nucleotide-binding universal stress UspA family protein
MSHAGARKDAAPAILSRWLMVRVADRVVRGATVPVLLVRSRKEGISEARIQPEG